MNAAKVAVVIPIWNGAAWLPGCLAALAAQTFRDFSVIAVDNGSIDASKDIFARHFPSAELICWEHNRGFAAAANAGIRASRSEFVALLNTDTIPKPNWLAYLVRALETSGPETVATASKMLSLDDPSKADDCGNSLSWQGSAVKRAHGRAASDFIASAEIFSPCAGAALYRRAFLDELGGFDERFFAYLEDIDLGLRGRLLGYRYYFEPSAEVLHKGHGSALRHSSYVRLITRNRIMLFLKNIPARLLISHAASLIYGQFYFFIAYRRPLASLAGFFSLLPLLAHIARSRRSILSSMKIDSVRLERMLSSRMEEPPLRALALKCWKGGMGGK